jgi:hypothetical protein
MKSFDIGPKLSGFQKSKAIKVSDPKVCEKFFEIEAKVSQSIKMHISNFNMPKINYFTHG